MEWFSFFLRKSRCVFTYFTDTLWILDSLEIKRIKLVKCGEFNSLSESGIKEYDKNMQAAPLKRPFKVNCVHIKKTNNVLVSPFTDNVLTSWSKNVYDFIYLYISVLFLHHKWSYIYNYTYAASKTLLINILSLAFFYFYFVMLFFFCLNQ